MSRHALSIWRAIFFFVSNVEFGSRNGENSILGSVVVFDIWDGKAAMVSLRGWLSSRLLLSSRALRKEIFVDLVQWLCRVKIVFHAFLSLTLNLVERRVMSSKSQLESAKRIILILNESNHIYLVILIFHLEIPTSSRSATCLTLKVGCMLFVRRYLSIICELWFCYR